jgi:hypothetical protein
MAYSRYNAFIKGAEYTKVPFIDVPFNQTDRYVTYKVGETRLDLLSYQYYDDPNYGWFILQANPSVGALEFTIKDGTRLRIPYPLQTALRGYEEGIARYKRLYGLD